jgi:hypothetical protein
MSALPARDKTKLEAALAKASSPAVGLCTLNQVDPYPIAYNLSNP